MIRQDLKKYSLPDSPGVYFFKKGRKLLYIGKAASLRDRVRSYFASDLAAGRGGRIVGMVAEAGSLSWQETGSVLEALILEANLIKRHQPPYNVDQKDNKSWNYVVITKEAFPRVLLVRGRELFGALKADSWKLKAVFGPFPHGGQLREALKIVRRIFPYRDTCAPCEVPEMLLPYLRKLANQERAKEKVGCQPCFNRQIGLCPGVCSGEISKEEYGRTIRNIRELFSGNFKGLKRRLARDMKMASAGEKFEDAARLRRQISALEHIHDVSLIKNDIRVSSGGGVRIEAFDVAHTGGTQTVAVMTVVDGGEAQKNAYRKFKIQSATNDDVAALKEVLSRRLNHTEWPLPRMFVVDGGKAQVRAAEGVLKKAGTTIPVVGVVKNQFHKPERLIGESRAIKVYEKDILLANAEAHRFGITYHRARRRRAMI
jgi:excinuclease ABC subunit C